MSDDKVVPIRRPEIIAEVGGIVDESRVTLCVYGEDLDPAAVTRLLGVSPTSSFLRGYRRKPSARPMPHGAWFLEVRGNAPDGPDVQLGKLLTLLPDSVDIWEELTRVYIVRLSICLGFAGWNKGFSFPADLIARAAKIGLGLDFDIYADDAIA
jgi:hypothetical protein